MSVARRRRSLGRLAQHRTRTRRYDDRCVRVTLSDLTVDVVAIERAVTREGNHRPRHLIEQRADLCAVIDIRIGQPDRNDLAGVGVHANRDRPQPGGTLCGVAKRATGPSFGGRVIRVEGPVHDGGSDLEPQMRSSRRPTHLLVGAHPPMQQPVHRALGGRRRYRLTASPGGGIIDDQTGLPGHVSLEANEQCLPPYPPSQRAAIPFQADGIEYHQGVSDEKSAPPVPARARDVNGYARSCRPGRRLPRDRPAGVRPALGGLSDMLDAHREMKTIEHVMGRATVAASPKDRGPSAPSLRMVTGVRGVAPRRCSTLLRNPAPVAADQPRPAPAKHGPLAGVVADLSDENLERAHLIAAHRFHMTPVDGERDRTPLRSTGSTPAVPRRRVPVWRRRAWSADGSSRLLGRPRAGGTLRAVSGRGDTAARRPSWRGCAHTPACSDPA